MAQVKPGAKADRDALRRNLLDLGADPSLIAVELQRAFRMRPREAWRHAHGWSQDDAADRYNAAMRRSGVGGADMVRSRIGDYERWPYGGRRPSPSVLATLARTYGATPCELLDADDLAHIPPAERTILLSAAQRPEASNRDQPLGVIAPVEPLDIQSLMASTITEDEVISIIEQRGAEFSAWAESSNVGPHTLDTIYASTRRIAHDYLTHAPLPLYLRAGELADRTWRLLTGHQPTGQTRDLYLAAGRLYALLAWMSGDLGQHGAAETHGRIAWICAEQADHDDLRAWTLSVQAKTAFWDKRFYASADLAQQGLQLARPGAAAVLLAHQNADALARLGATDDALAALGRARAESDRAADRTDDIGGLWACGPVRQANYASAVLINIGHADEAGIEAGRGIAALNGDDETTYGYGTIAQLYISAARAYAQAGRLDAATAAIRPVLDLPADQRLDTVRRRVADFSNDLNSPQLRTNIESRALHSEIDDWRRTSVVRAIAQ